MHLEYVLEDMSSVFRKQGLSMKQVLATYARLFQVGIVEMMKNVGAVKSADFTNAYVSSKRKADDISVPRAVANDDDETEDEFAQPAECVSPVPTRRRITPVVEPVSN